MNLYQITTSYEGSANYAKYFVIADNGVSAGSVVNLMVNSKIRKTVKKNGKVNYAKEQVDEIERVADDVIIPDYVLTSLAMTKKK